MFAEVERIEGVAGLGRICETVEICGKGPMRQVLFLVKAQARKCSGVSSAEACLYTEDCVSSK